MEPNNDPPLTAAEIREWVAGMGRNDKERISAIRQLLKHKYQDQMSVKDAAICEQELKKLLNNQATKNLRVKVSKGVLVKEFNVNTRQRHT